MNIQTNKIAALWLVKKSGRTDLDAFCSTIKYLKDKIFELGSGTNVYEVRFWQVTPTFKKLTKVQVKKLIEDHLNEKGWHKDHYNFNKAEKWEKTPPKRKIPARNVVKKTITKKISPKKKIVNYKNNPEYLKLINKALKLIPNSPAQKKVMLEIEKKFYK